MFQAASKKKPFGTRIMACVFSIQNQQINLHFIKATLTKHEGCEERKDDQLMSDETDKMWRK